MESLRHRQKEAVENISDAYASGFKAPILVASTGFGKTHSAAAIIRRSLRKGKTVWFLAHLTELLADTSRRLIDDGISHGWIASGMPETPHISVQLCMVQTLINRLSRCARPDLIIIDESHLAVAATYQEIFKWAEAGPKFYRPGGSYLLHLTATPQRLDGRGMGEVSDIIIPTCSTDELINDGLLVPVRYFQPNVADAMGRRRMVGTSLEHYLSHAAGRAAIGFSATNAAAEKSAEAFRKEGISAISVSGDSSDEDRRDALNGIRTGKYQVVFNCKLWIAGVDAPNVSCIIDEAPTESLTRFLQGLGRGIRLHPGKNDLVYLDCVNNLKVHGNPTAEREWTLEGADKGSGRIKDVEAFSVKTCPVCFAVNQSEQKICHHCRHTFGPTPRELKIIHGQLEEVKRFERIEKKKEQGQAKTLEDLIKVGVQRGYKNPVFWAKKVLGGRR